MPPPQKPSGAKKPDQVTKTVSDIFAKIQAKTKVDNKKVDEWQKKWLTMPEKRTKYKHLEDAPQIAGEELFAMCNDIIDFIQKQEGGKSTVPKKLKAKGGLFFKQSLDFLKQQYKKSKEFIKKETKAKPPKK